MKKLNMNMGELYTKYVALMSVGVIKLKFSRSGALSIYRNVKKIEEELSDYINERQKLIVEYKTGDKDVVDNTNPKWNDFLKELNDLNSVETSLELNIIHEDDLPENLSVEQISVLEFMVADNKNEGE